jgi:acyl-CoA synthetase (AMP-forming)/AMP-acid ligase II/acyl carrier protein
LLRLSETEHLLLLTLHHIIADGWSVGILIRELSSFYQGEELAELSIQYGDYAVWQREWLQGEKLAEELGYWREQLSGAPAVLSLPTDQVRPAVQSFRGGRERLELSGELLRELQQLSQEQGATLFMTLLGAFQVLLWRLSGQRDVVVGSPIANRQRSELEGLIGFFANTLVLRTQVSGSESFRELLARVKETCLGAYAHQDVPFEKLVEELQPERSLSHTPLFQVAFVLQNEPTQKLELPGLVFDYMPQEDKRAKFDVIMTLTETPEGLRAMLEYNADIFETATARRMLSGYETLLSDLVASPETKLAKLSLLTETEQLNDGGVWIRGYQIDLAEVELALLQEPAVTECAVRARISDDGEMQLVAYVVTSAFFQPERLNSFLQDKLRPQMIPSAYVPVISIPLTEDGEIDEQELSRLPVIDSKVLSTWEKQLSAQPDIDQVAVVIQEATEPTTQLNLSELVPDRMPLSTGSDSDRMGHAKATTLAATNSTKIAISHGDPLDETDLATTLIQALQRAADGSPADSLVYYQRDGSTLVQSYAELLEEAERIVGSLRRLGLKPQDKVIFQLDRSQDFVPAFWACILGGFIPVPVSIAPIYEESNSTVSKLLNSWQMLDQPLVVASREIATALKSLNQDLSVAVIDDLRNGNPDHDWYDAKPDDVALILLTSGSTGMPKGVVQTHRRILGRSAATAQMNNFSSADVSLNWFPLDHVGGLVMFHVRDVCTRTRQIQVPTDAILADPLKWLDLIEQYRVTVTWAPNFAYSLINDRLTGNSRNWDLSSLRFILNGGEAVVARTARRFLDLLAPFGVPATAMHPAWGMSETCSGVTYSDRFTCESTSDDDAFVEVGAPIPGISVRITDAQDQPVAEEMIGRLQVRGVSVLSHYYNNPEVNQQSFTSDGWFITGDIGFLKDGRLTITGREKDVIIINGANFYSHEIESVVEEIEGVEVSFTAACAIAQAGSDTDRLAIFFNTESSDSLSLINEIRQRVVRSIGVNASFVIPVAKDDIPKTAIGKIQRSQLVDQFNDGAFDHILRQIELESGRGKTLPDWFFKKTWRRRAVNQLPLSASGNTLSQQSEPSAVAPGRTLIFCDNTGLGRQLRNDLASIIVEAGDKFTRISTDTYRINITNPDDYHQLIRSLASDQIQVTQILHLFTYGDYAGEPTSQAQLDQAQDQGLYSLLYLVQALDDEKPIHLLVASTHAQPVSATDPVAYEKSTMFGLLKTLPLERQWLTCSHVDLPVDQPSVNAARILSEITSATAEVAYRNGQRWVSQLEKVNLGRQPLHDLPFKSGGMYLLTGGLGGIAVEIARYLLKNYDARLLLVGRTSLAERLESYEELKRLGDVTYESVDITDLEDVQRIVSEAETRWNCELDGVIHLAGTLQEQLLEHATRESVDATLRAKVFGTWTLHELLKSRRQDLLFISFSSVNSFFGGVTVGAYAAANSFLETFMQYRRNQGWSNSYSYSWSLWDETGMTRGYLLKDLSRARGYYAISTEQGVNSWLAGLHRREPQLLIGLDGSNRSIRPHVAGGPCLQQKVTAYFTSSVAVVQLPEAAVLDRFQQPVECEFVQLDELPLKENGEVDVEKLSGLSAGELCVSNDDEPASDTEIELSKIWQELLSVQRVARHDNFFQLGGHSLLSMQLISRLRDTFHIELPLRTLFESSTVAGLAQQIDTIQWVTQGPSIGSQHEEGVL